MMLFLLAMAMAAPMLPTETPSESESVKPPLLVSAYLRETRRLNPIPINPDQPLHPDIKMTQSKVRDKLHVKLESVLNFESLSLAEKTRKQYKKDVKNYERTMRRAKQRDDENGTGFRSEANDWQYDHGKERENDRKSFKKPSDSDLSHARHSSAEEIDERDENRTEFLTKENEWQYHHRIKRKNDRKSLKNPTDSDLSHAHHSSAEEFGERDESETDFRSDENELENTARKNRNNARKSLKKPTDTDLSHIRNFTVDDFGEGDESGTDFRSDENEWQNTARKNRNNARKSLQKPTDTHLSHARHVSAEEIKERDRAQRERMNARLPPDWDEWVAARTALEQEEKDKITRAKKAEVLREKEGLRRRQKGYEW